MKRPSTAVMVRKGERILNSHEFPCTSSICLSFTKKYCHVAERLCMYFILPTIPIHQILLLSAPFLSQFRTMLIPPTFLEISGMRFLITGVGHQKSILGR